MRRRSGHVRPLVFGLILFTTAVIIPPPLAASVSGDGDRPPAPTDVMVEAGDGLVVVNWTAVTSEDPIVAYDLWRNGDWVGWVAAPATTWTDSCPLDNAYYQVRALTAGGSRSPWSDRVHHPASGPEEPDTVAPPTPTGLTAIEVSGRIELTWDPVVDGGGSGLKEYEIWRNGAWYGWLPATSTPRWTDPAPLDVDMRYQVRAVDHAGNKSRFSYRTVVEGAVAGDDVAPPRVSVITAVEVDDGVLIEWEPVVDQGSGVKEYQIYRKQYLGPAVYIGWMPASTTSFLDPVPGDTDSYMIRTSDHAGNRSWSRPVGVQGRGPAPVTDLRITDKQVEAFVDFAWEPSAQAVEYELWFTDDNTHLILARTTETFFHYDNGTRLRTTPPGLRMEVTAIDQNGNRSAVTTIHLSVDNLANVDGYTSERDAPPPTTPPAPDVHLEQPFEFRPYSGPIEEFDPAVVVAWPQSVDNFRVAEYQVIRDGQIIETVETASANVICLTIDCRRFVALDGAFQCLGPGCTMFWLDRTAVAGESHRYQIVAVDHAGNRSVAGPPTSYGI